MNAIRNISVKTALKSQSIIRHTDKHHGLIMTDGWTLPSALSPFFAMLRDR